MLLMLSFHYLSIRPPIHLSIYLIYLCPLLSCIAVNSIYIYIFYTILYVIDLVVSVL